MEIKKLKQRFIKRWQPKHGISGIARINFNKQLDVLLNEYVRQEPKFFRKRTDNELWKIITDLGWGTKTVDYRKLNDRLHSDYEIYFHELSEFVQKRRAEVKNALNEYQRKNTKNINFYGLGDDGFWDLTAHIVGLGVKKYKEVINNPLIAKKMADDRDFKENFQYIFNG